MKKVIIIGVILIAIAVIVYFATKKKVTVVSSTTTSTNKDVIAGQVTSPTVASTLNTLTPAQQIQIAINAEAIEATSGRN